MEIVVKNGLDMWKSGYGRDNNNNNTTSQYDPAYVGSENCSEEWIGYGRENMGNSGRKKMSLYEFVKKRANIE